MVEMISKTVNITKDQERFLDDHNMICSKIVRNLLKKFIVDYKKKYGDNNE